MAFHPTYSSIQKVAISIPFGVMLCDCIYIIFFAEFIPYFHVSLYSFYLSVMLAYGYVVWIYVLKRQGLWQKNSDPRFAFSKPTIYLNWILLLPLLLSLMLWINLSGMLPYLYTQAFGQKVASIYLASAKIRPKSTFCRYQLVIPQYNHFYFFEYCLNKQQYQYFSAKRKPIPVKLHVKQSRFGLIVKFFEFINLPQNSPSKIHPNSS